MVEKYICLKTYQDDECYGVDFYVGKIYEYKNGYMYSTENGTDVMISDRELKQYWQKAKR